MITNSNLIERPITVSIVDDDHELSSGLQYIINNVEGFLCPMVYHSADETLNGLAEREDSLPDVILMDIGMKGKDGIACVREVHALYPSIQVVMQTVFTSDDKIFESLRAGAVGYILKNSTKEKLLEAIKEARDGGAPMTGSIARRVLTHFQHPKENELTQHLTEREREVLELLVQGHSYKMIGETLFISPFTVRHHLHKIYQKLHVRSRGEAVAIVQGHRT
jgi:DNA-binding NarL/FixJ family response regulator